MPRARHHERGVALILVLGLISIMSTAAVFSFDSLSRLIKRNLIEQERAQARYYAVAAEQIGIQQMRDLITDRTNFGLVMAQNLNRYDYVIGGAALTVVADDISNCFNVHALVQGSNTEGFQADPEGVRHFANFLQLYGVGRKAAQAMSAALADWQDSDKVPLPGGAESGFYAERDPAYRAPDAPVGDISELRMIADFSPDLLDALGELICAGGVENAVRLNVSTLRPRHAPLLAALLADTVSEEAVADFLTTTQLGAFDNESSFFKSGLFADASPSSEVKRKFERFPSRVRLRISADYGDAKVQLVTEVRFNSNGTYAIISRKFGV